MVNSAKIQPFCNQRDVMNLSAINPEYYQAQLNEKISRIQEQFASFNPPKMDIFASKPEHYRYRAEFRVWHDGDDLYYIVFDQKTKQKIRVDQFLPASKRINDAMRDLLEIIKHNPTLRYKLFQVDFLSTLSGELLISLLYHKQLDDAWHEQATELRQTLTIKYPVHLIGRAKKQKIVLEQDFVVEKLSVDGQELIYQQIENSFTQPNADVATHMLEWSIEATRHSDGDLLELYCGNGNFSLALAKNFRQVLATEISKPSVQSAQYNMAENNIENVTVIRMSAEEFTQAMNKERAFKRLEGIDLDSFDCNTIFVDPPRQGLDCETEALVANYHKIIYISCNPETLHKNLETLGNTHKITHMALFDQFPYTHHVELGVVLEKK